MTSSPFVPVIPAGGSGTRLWPLSRRSHPKFLLDLTGSGASLLQQTVNRLLPLADEPPLVVTGTSHAGAVQAQVGELTQVLTEPAPRNSMPAIAYAAAIVERAHPEAVIGSFAADHLITDTAAFADGVAAARRAAELGYLVTLGVHPTYPATGFGYIEQVGAEGTGSTGGPEHPERPDLSGTGALPVARFVEKPERERAEEFLASGRFSWNAGMFVVKASVLLDALAEQIPSLAAGARRLAAAHGSAEEDAVLAEVWPTLTSIAIDHALAEPLAAVGRVAVVPARFDWDDVGDFAALARQLRTTPVAAAVRPVSGDDSDVRVLAGTDPAKVADDVSDAGDARASESRVMAVGSRATVYGSTHRHIALVGLEGISVVDTEDALLILSEERAQDLSSLVAELDALGLGRLR